MRLLSLFLVLIFFLCHTSIASTLNSFVAEEQSEVPSCHVVSGNDSSNSHAEKAEEDNFSLPQDEVSSSCCLLSLLNAKDLDSKFEYNLSLIGASTFFEKTALSESKVSSPHFKLGHSPPDLIIQKSSFLI